MFAMPIRVGAFDPWFGSSLGGNVHDYREVWLG